MTWRSEKTRTGSDYVWNGVEYGISSSPVNGIANMQNVNISTETGEVMASFARASQTPTAITNGTLTPAGATDFTGPATLKAGMWINVTASTVSSITAATNPTTASADYLVVGGGGAGGSSDSSSGAGGGGGAGQFLTGSNNFSVGSYSVTVGDGGTAVAQASGGNGNNSVISGVATAYGGAGGAKNGTNGVNATTGGSGSGGGSGATTGGTGATGGNNGGTGTATNNGAGGGGGSSAAGGNASSSDGGTGGAGTASTITGVNTTYAGGGGGGRDGGSGGLGGAGGGGNANLNADGSGSAGTANTGGGGGGAGGNAPFIGGNGGSGIAVISYTTGTMYATGGIVYKNGTKTVHVFKESGVFTVLSIPTGGLYYVSYASGTTFRLSSKYDPTGANVLTHGTNGSITFSTVAVPNQAVAKSTEKYTTSTGTEYRYYVLDLNGYVWVFDSRINETYGTQWMLPDPTNYSTLKFTGLAVLNGFVLVVCPSYIAGKPVNSLGDQFIKVTNADLNNPFPTHTNFALAGNQGKMYYCDGNYIGELFPTTSLETSIANIQSNCQYTASTTTGTISNIVNGSLPYDPGGVRIPAVFYTDVYGTQPTNLTSFSVYYIDYNPLTGTFQVFSALTGGTAIDIASGAAGNQFFNTFYPFGDDAGINGTDTLVQFSSQRVNLPARETAQCMVEIGNTVLIGGTTNVLYPWNQIDATPSDFITLPEANVKTMINVNNMAYVFAGNKGNIYISNGAVASLTLKVPDYVAGVPGNKYSYIEPYFTWGDAMYCRGRVYFSILDQTATKAGNCGGNWSFVPTQNMDPNQEIGMALRLENQNSYGDYDGYSTILIPNEEQNAIAPQYWAWWQDSYNTSSAAFGVDYSTSNPVTKYVVETDILPTGTMLEKGTFQQLEYKLTSALEAGDSVQLFYRTNATDAWSSYGTVVEDVDTADQTFPKISGYFEQVIERTQWLQFRIEATTNGTTTSSFVRLRHLMLR